MGEIFDDTILLKIKRDFTENEAVQQLLKMVSELEMEIGMLKSERDEWKDKAAKIRSERTQTRKQWLQDEIFVELQAEMNHVKIKNKEYKKGLDDWRNKYFSLLATKNTHSNQLQPQESNKTGEEGIYKGEIPLKFEP